MVPAEFDFGALDGTWFHHWQTLTQSGLMLSVRAPEDSHFLGGSANGEGDKKFPLFKGTPALPPLDWETATASTSMMWRVKDVEWFQWNYWMPHPKFEDSSWNRNANVCITRFGWMFYCLTGVCLPPNQKNSCWSLFVKLHKFPFGEIRLSSFFKRVTSSWGALLESGDKHQHHTS